MKRLFYWAVFLVGLMAATAVLSRELPPMPLRQYVAQFPVIYVGECQVEKLKYPMLPCAVYYDGERELRYVVLAQNGKHISHVIAVSKDGEPHVLWVSNDQST